MPVINNRDDDDACTNLKKEATSIMSGISNEKPALDFFRCIESAWSL